MRNIFGERRLTHYSLPQGPGYWDDLNNRYFKGGMIDKLEGGWDLFWSGLDQGLRYGVGKEYKAPQGILGRTRRDLGELFHDVTHFKPVHAVTDFVRIIGGDLEVDATNLFTGNHTTSTRHSMHKVLAKEDSYTLAA